MKFCNSQMVVLLYSKCMFNRKKKCLEINIGISIINLTFFSMILRKDIFKHRYGLSAHSKIFICFEESSLKLKREIICFLKRQIKTTTKWYTILIQRLASIQPSQISNHHVVINFAEADNYAEALSGITMAFIVISYPKLV